MELVGAWNPPNLRQPIKWLVRAMQATVVVIDQSGTVIGEWQLLDQKYSNQNATRLLIADCDQDGNDEIIAANGGLDVLRSVNEIEMLCSGGG